MKRAIVSSEGSGPLKLLVDGGNFRGVITSPGVCPKTATTNNITQIESVLGIEAAR